MKKIINFDIQCIMEDSELNIKNEEYCLKTLAENILYGNSFKSKLNYADMYYGDEYDD